MKSKKFLFLMLILLYCTTAYANELQYLYSYIKNNKLIEAKEELLNDSRAFGDPQKAAKIIANHLMKNKQYDHAAEMYAYCIKFSSYYDELRKKISLKYLKASLEAPKFLDKWRETYQYEINDKMRELAKKSLKNKFETYKFDPINKKYPEKAYSRLAKLVGFKEKPYNEIKNAVAKIDKLKKDAQSKSQIGSVLKEIRVLKRNGINVSRDFEEKYTNLNEYYVEFNRGKSTNSFETGCEAYKSALTYLKLANGKDTESAKCSKRRSCLYVEGDEFVPSILPKDDDKSATINKKLHNIHDFQKKINQFESECSPLTYPPLSDHIGLLEVADNYYTSLNELKNNENENKLIAFYNKYQENKKYFDWHWSAGFHIGVHYYNVAKKLLTHSPADETTILDKLKNAVTNFKKFKTYIKSNTLEIDIIKQYKLLTSTLDNIKNGKIDTTDIKKLKKQIKDAWDIDQRIKIHYYNIAMKYLTEEHKSADEASILVKLKNAVTNFKNFGNSATLETDITKQYNLLTSTLDNIKKDKIDAINIIKLEKKIKKAWNIDQRIKKIIKEKEQPRKNENMPPKEEKDNESPIITINITFRSTSMNITNTNNVSPINITNTNNVSFECIGKDNKPDFLHYSYRLLKPYDKDWSENSPSTQIRKKDLKNGDYILQVKAIDDEGNESKPIECFFKVQVPFYHQMIRMENLQVLPSHSMWFVVIILLMVFSAIIYMFIFFIYKLKNYRFITFLKELFNRLLSSLTSICKKDKEKEKQYSINVVSSLKNFHIKNFNCIKEITRNNISKSPWILITGENGTGKTSLLQALVIALHYTNDKYVKKLLTDNENCQINVKIQKNKKTYERRFVQLDGNWITTDPEKRNTISEPEPNILAYGSVRLNIGQKKNKKSPVSNLLNHNIELSNIMHWLKEKKDAKERDFTKLTNNVMECIASLIPNISEIKIEGEGIFCQENGQELNINQLSAGQKSILAMVGDMIVRLFDAQPGIKDTKELEGIVFIDTLESHLHPTWQKEFPRLLSEHFPGVQFIATTNSPFAGVPKGSLFFKLSKNTEHNTDIKEWQNLKGALCREK
ncbi:exported hypothetical protein [Candidatus Magnetomoraceae bacterium gMMP-15]